MNVNRSSLTLRIILLALLATRAMAPSSFASADLEVSQPAASPDVEQSSEIDANDEINVTIINFPNLNTLTVVPRDGRVTLPLVGDVNVIGLTTLQLSNELTPLFSKYLKEPIVGVSLAVKHPELVNIGGSVVRPGSVSYVPGMRLIDAVIQAGGPSASADLSQASVVHLDGSQQITNICGLSTVEGTTADVVLKEGDTVYIPQSTREISIVGQVKNAGSYPYHDSMTVLDAIGLGGGVTEIADLQHAVVINGASTTPVDLQKLLQQGDTSANILLHPGDTISIPLVSRNYIFGDVNKPGYYSYEPGDRLVDALNGAGGTTQNADTSKIYVIRVDSDKTKAKSTPVDLNKFFKDGDITANVPLNPGDVVFVADKSKKGVDLNGASSVLYALGFLTRL